MHLVQAFLFQELHQPYFSFLLFKNGFWIWMRTLILMLLLGRFLVALSMKLFTSRSPSMSLNLYPFFLQSSLHMPS